MRKIIITSSFLALLLLSLMRAESVDASHLSCGDIVTGNVKLDADLSCLTGSGLIIGANGTKINLRGYIITGDPSVGSSYGIDNTGGFDDVEIKDGFIVGFEQGIRATGASNLRIKDINFLGQTSSHAIDILDSDAVQIKDSTFSLPAWSFGGPEAVRLESVNGVSVKDIDVSGGFIGVNFACGVCDGSEDPTNGVVKDSTFSENFIGVEIANSTDAYIKNNKISGAAYAGIEIDFVANTGTTITHNEIFDGGGFLTFGFGIIVSESTTGLVIKQNNIHDNFSDGIQLNDVDDSGIYKNLVKDNGTAGIALFFGSTGNSIDKNIVTGHTFDLHHDGSSTVNTWKKNTCGTKLGSDIPPC